MSNSLRSLKTNQRPWGNRSGCSEEMHNRERITQAAQRKWATVRESLRSIRGNKWPWADCSDHSRQMSNPEQFAQVAQRKWAIERFAQKNLALYTFFFYERIAHFLFFGERCELIPQVAHPKWAMWAKLLRLLTKNEQREQIAYKNKILDFFSQNF